MDNKNLEALLRIIRATRRDLAMCSDAESRAQVAIIDQMMAQYNADTVGLTVSEVANSLGVCSQSVLEYIKSGLLPARKRKNGRYVIQKADVDKFDRPRIGRPPKIR
jgi:excisionase family DNA binding protein